MKNKYTLDLKALFKEEVRYDKHNIFSDMSQVSLTLQEASMSFEGLDLREYMTENNTKIVFLINEKKFTNIKATCNMIKDTIFSDNVLTLNKADHKEYGTTMQMFEHAMKVMGVRINFHPVIVFANRGTEGANVADFKFELRIELHSISEVDVATSASDRDDAILKRWYKHFTHYNLGRGLFQGRIMFKLSSVLRHAEVIRDRHHNAKFEESIFLPNKYERSIIIEADALDALMSSMVKSG